MADVAIVQEHPGLASEEDASLLLTLPDDCLLPILQCCAASDQRSLFSAARAHIRLHQAAVAALRSITAPMTQKQQLDGVLLYLSKHGGHIDSVKLKGDGGGKVALRHLPDGLHLSSLQLSQLDMQLLPGYGFLGILPEATPQSTLKHLQLSSCHVSGSAATERFAEALSLLPAGLQHLSLRSLSSNNQMAQFPTAVLQQLQQLTCLELADVSVLGPTKTSPVLQPLQPLQALTRLEHLRLCDVHAEPRGVEGGTRRPTSRFTANMLSGASHLTHLELSTGSVDGAVVWDVEPGALDGKTRLHHLNLSRCNIVGGAEGIAQLLCELQQLQEVTHLNLTCSLTAQIDRLEGCTPPAAAYAALTASSKLQKLNIAGAFFPVGFWQHMFPVGRQLSHLRSLGISHISHPFSSMVAAPEGSRLVSCCPALQSINMERSQYSEEVIEALQGLSELQELHIGMSRHAGFHAPASLDGVQYLTGLRRLRVTLPDSAEEGLLLQLTELKQLENLVWQGPTGCSKLGMLRLEQGDGDEPVWQQILRLHLDHSDPEVARHAAAALAEAGVQCELNGAASGSLTEAPDGDITAAAVAVGGSTGCSRGFCCFQAPRPARMCAGDTVMDSSNGGRFGGRTNLAAAQDLPAAAVASSIKAERQCRWWWCW